MPSHGLRPSAQPPRRRRATPSPSSDVGGNPAAVASAVEFILEGSASQSPSEQRRSAMDRRATAVGVRLRNGRQGAADGRLSHDRQFLALGRHPADRFRSRRTTSCERCPTSWSRTATSCAPCAGSSAGFRDGRRRASAGLEGADAACARAARSSSTATTCSMLEDIRDRLQDIVETEREGIERSRRGRRGSDLPTPEERADTGTRCTTRVRAGSRAR